MNSRKGKMLLDRIERRAVWAIVAIGAAVILSAWLSVPVRQDDPPAPVALSQHQR
jgi:predicted MFS family arabinose efflux permease